MRIILKDEEPVCQHPRRLAFTERQEVNKQIEEWLNEGIIRPSSSEYANHIVESGTIKPSPTKTLAVRKFPEPTTIKQVQSFLGLTGYFRKYIKDYSKIAKPFSDLTRKENIFVFGTQQKEAFEKLKKIMSEGPILHLYKRLCRKKDLITRIARWALQLEEFDYEIEHRAGSRMKHVDALSRYPVMMLIRKTGKKGRVLNPISKESIPLSTYYVDFVGPLPSTNKSYQHIFTVVDVFTKFSWLYPVKTVSAESALEKLKQQQKTFGNPIRIISDSDRGSAFTSKLFNDYCDEENIQHLQIATGVPRGN
ncbi:retrovirus-related Pol polyprotein from transposon 17.6 [Trichonephila clavipes]|nr:retrovirus-related Pol polyprotein from transposon 17.6 [Trichonephila clavipes]